MLSEVVSESSGPQRERCLYLDRFVKDLWLPLFKETGTVEDNLSLVALGGYGEGLLCPGSDVDLLFLHQGLSENILARFVEKVVYPLWDYRFEVSYRVFTPREALDFAAEDPTFFTSLLSARLLCGSEALFQELLEGFEGLLSGREKEFYERLKALREARLSRLGEEVYFLEPHLKDGPGGLRDFQFFLWAGRIIFGFEKLSDFTEAGLISLEEEKKILAAAEFLRRVREELHILCARKEDRLFMEYQPEIAARLGFGSGDRAGTEAFISKLFTAFSTIKEAVENLIEEIEDLFFTSQRKKRLTLIQPVPSGPFLRRIFETLAREGRPFDRNLKRYLRSRKWSEKDLVDLREAFSELLTLPYSLTMLHTMRETAILFRLIPEFKDLCGRVQYDVYHLYALDEHLFLTISALHHLKKEKSELWTSIENEKILYFAALLHDLAKGEPDHARRGAEKVLKIASRFNFQAEEIKEIAFLVEQHLLLMDTALRRDLAEEKVIEEVVLRTERVERLTALYFLTLADAMATGPRALNAWKAGLLEELFSKAKKLFENRMERESLKDLSQKRTKLYEKFRPELVDRIPLPQLEIYDVGELEELLSLVQGFLSENALFLFAEHRLNGVVKVFIVTKDKTGLFSDIVGTFFASGFDIRRARAFTWAGGLAVDEFWVEPLVEGAELSNWKGLFEKVLAGKEYTEDLVQRRKEAFLRLGPKIPLVSFPEIRIDQEASDFYTLLEIYAPDKPGLLYEIASIISEQKFIIGKAILSEKEDLVADIFYLQTQEGEKLSAEEVEGLVQKLQIKLKEVVS
ncbi:HD domain-containing protein [Thermosulfurimonas dismutans]|uniref:Bifunctional uridylyltransferase/uridylyl-removing enzyme n=1 Tax=Thermosulfurimonas dismutans TaxID=999894 RepID=A0A179D4Y4_9BACT|nr:HD domain-containing protein [Thermosulfurimonas dismutans]OAQ21117.1 [Protein-PII] uridylyltransferase [Thermosulfurimonas dismutans]